MRGSLMIGLRCWMNTPGSDSDRPSRLPASEALRVWASPPLTTLDAVSDWTALGRDAAAWLALSEPVPPRVWAGGWPGAGVARGCVCVIGWSCVGGVVDTGSG